MQRTAKEVFGDHVRCRAPCRLEDDLARNYAADVVLLCEFGVMQGRNAIRKSAHKLRLQLPDGHFDFLAKQVEGKYAFFKWRGESAHTNVGYGADPCVAACERAQGGASLCMTSAGFSPPL